MNLLLVARRKALLDTLVDECASRFAVEARGLEADLGTPDFIEKIGQAAEGLDLGLVVYNAAYAPMGGFYEMDPADLSRVVDVNVRGPLTLVRRVAGDGRPRARSRDPDVLPRGQPRIAGDSGLCREQGIQQDFGGEPLERAQAQGRRHTRLLRGSHPNPRLQGFVRKARPRSCPP